MPRILPHVPERCLRAVFFFAAIAAGLAISGSAEAAPPSLREIVSRVEATYNRADDFRADFVQESKIASMGKTIHEEGTMSYRFFSGSPTVGRVGPEWHPLPETLAEADRLAASIERAVSRETCGWVVCGLWCP